MTLLYVVRAGSVKWDFNFSLLIRVFLVNTPMYLNCYMLLFTILKFPQGAVAASLSWEVVR